jgi:hypothetical protein
MVRLIRWIDKHPLIHSGFDPLLGKT